MKNMKKLESKTSILKEMVGVPTTPLDITFGDDGRLIINDIYGNFHELNEETIKSSVNERFIVNNYEDVVTAPEINMDEVLLQRGKSLANKSYGDLSLNTIPCLDILLEIVTGVNPLNEMEMMGRLNRIKDDRIFESREADKDKFNMPDKSRLDEDDMGKVLRRAILTASDDIDLSILKSLAVSNKSGTILIQSEPEIIDKDTKPRKRSHKKWERLAYIRSLLAINQFSKGNFKYGYGNSVFDLANRNDVAILRQGEIGPHKLIDSMLDKCDPQRVTKYEIEFAEPIGNKYFTKPVMVINNLYYMGNKGDFRKVIKKTERYMDSVCQIIKGRNERGLLTIIETGIGINQFSAWPLCQLLDLIKENEINAILSVGKEIGGQA